MFVATVAAIAGVWIVLYYWDVIRARTRKRHDEPQALFDELCHAHGLSRNERDLLAEVAEGRRLAQPAAIFIDPRHLQESPQTPTIASLVSRLFGAAADH